jgi:cellulose synthase/poly-beta-1,6-N-acetylglucosamine synthase-like glycosyltransferase
VDPKNRDVQIEIEKACTLYLKETGAYLKPEFQSIHLSSMDFQTEASVIIPVRNREKTIEDAVRSALQQQTNFPFNVIVIDNHSTDSTTAILKKMA